MRTGVGHNQRSFAEPDPSLKDKTRIDERDILQAARRSQGVERLDQTKHAVLERSGGISVVPKQGGERPFRRRRRADGTGMGHLVGGVGGVGWVVAKTLLLYLTALVGFRVGERRTLAQMSPFDFVAAVAVGAIVGRVPTAS